MINRLLVCATLIGVGAYIAGSPAATQWMASVKPVTTAIAASPTPVVSADQAKATHLFEEYEKLIQQDWPPKGTGGFLGVEEAIAKAHREIDAARTAFANFLCTLRSADNWVGSIAHVSKDGSLGIKIGTVKSSNMKMPADFVVTNHTKIGEDTAVYQAMGRLERGTMVKFSGKFVVSKTCAVQSNPPRQAPGLTINFEQISPL